MWQRRHVPELSENFNKNLRSVIVVVGLVHDQAGSRSFEFKGVLSRVSGGKQDPKHSMEGPRTVSH